MMSEVLRRALQKPGLIRDEDTTIIFYDLSHLEERIARVISLFPDKTLHAAAIKANPLFRILRHTTSLGLGLEAASLPELRLAQKTGIPAKRIVFDSPAKTKSELEYALSSGVHVNADSLAELERIDAIQANSPSVSTIGIRINPQIGTGAITTTSVAGDYSKFGVPLKERKLDLLDSFVTYPWLRGVHIHIGSQGCSIDLLVKGVAIVIDFINEANQHLRDHREARQIDIIDIGGGLPVSYCREDKPVSMEEYCDQVLALLRRCSSTSIQLITEFGRYFHANTGWVASRVEYVKTAGSIDTAIIHCGADLLLRECYRPDDWHHDISVVDRHGRLRSGDITREYVVAGPLCFAGDAIAHGVELPVIEEGDYVLIHDAGAYTLSMWSRYNSRQFPKVLGYTDQGAGFEILKAREKPEDLWRFWS
jgi:diaminopimelate decarboxylase